MSGAEKRPYFAVAFAGLDAHLGQHLMQECLTRQCQSRFSAAIQWQMRLMRHLSGGTPGFNQESY